MLDVRLIFYKYFFSSPVPQGLPGRTIVYLMDGCYDTASVMILSNWVLQVMLGSIFVLFPAHQIDVNTSSMLMLSLLGYLGLGYYEEG